MVYFSQIFQNTACNSTSNGNKIGTCYTTEECRDKMLEAQVQFRVMEEVIKVMEDNEKLVKVNERL